MAGAGRNTFTIEVAENDGEDHVTIGGVIDENADLTALTQLGARPIRIHVKGVRRINSFGVRSWIDAIRQIPATTPLRIVHAPPSVVDQCNMVQGFFGHGKLVSFYAPMTCSECDEQVDQLFETAACRANGGRLPSTPCPRCGRPMEVDDLEEQYLLFVRVEAGGAS
jgi:hypothetical protein